MTPTRPRLSRRRALTILGAAGGVALVPALMRSPRAAPLRTWQTTALGAPARIVLAHPDAAEAARLFEACSAEIARLEALFSLERADSALVRLNRDGAIAAPAPDMVRLLEEAQRVSRASDGAFDVTVQPLWRLYAEHFARPGHDAGGPGAGEIAAALALVGWRALEVAPDRIAFARAGMAATLNGIAQGFITDRASELLRARGITSVLVDLGEHRALGAHPDGRPWRVGLADPFDPAHVAATLDLVDRAVATSGGYGTRFSADGRFHHLFDPRTGASANRHASVSVIADTATTADALSTALYVGPDTLARRIAAAEPGIEVRLTAADGTVSTVGG